MAIPNHFCCCSGGCNGYIDEDGEPSNGFGSGVAGKADCNRTDDCDGDGFAETTTMCGCENDLEDSDCCGPSVPDYVLINSNVYWDWGWFRKALSATCQGTAAPADPPSVSYNCNEQNIRVWEHDDGGWDWVQSEAITNLKLELNNAIADPGDGEMAPGCCAKYYYGSMEIDGPTRKGFNTNPWGLPSIGWDSALSYQAPPKLRVVGRLVLQFKGKGPNDEIPVIHPTVACLAKLSLWIGLDGYGTTYHECVANNGWQSGTFSQAAFLVNLSVVNVVGCSCNGMGYLPPTDPTDPGDEPLVHVLDTIDWGNNLKGDWGSFWHYAWPHPTNPDSTGTATWGTTPGRGGVCGSLGTCPVTGSPFYLSAFSGCSDISLANCTSGCADPEVWWRPAGAIDGNWSCKRPGTYVWTTFEDQDGATDINYGDQPNPDNTDTSWQCYLYENNNPCHTTGSAHTGPTFQVRGGFRGKFGAESIVFPNAGLKDLQIEFPGYPGVEYPEQ